MHRITLTVLLLGFFSLSTMAQTKVAYMNPNAVLAQIEEVAIIDKQIQALVSQRDQEIMNKASALQQAISDYEEIRSSLQQAEQQAKEAELLEKNKSLEAERESYLNEIRQKRVKLLEPILKRMDNALKKVAISMGIDLVLNEGTSYGDVIIFYANEERLNITEEVLQELKSE